MNRQDNINFLVCFSQTIEIMLFTLTVYAITIKKIQTRQGISSFQ
jgi:hypothetical protein